MQILTLFFIISAMNPSDRFLYVCMLLNGISEVYLEFFITDDRRSGSSTNNIMGLFPERKYKLQQLKDF